MTIGTVGAWLPTAIGASSRPVGASVANIDARCAATSCTPTASCCSRSACARSALGVLNTRPRAPGSRWRCSRCAVLVGGFLLSVRSLLLLYVVVAAVAVFEYSHGSRSVGSVLRRVRDRRDRAAVRPQPRAARASRAPAVTRCWSTCATGCAPRARCRRCPTAGRPRSCCAPPAARRSPATSSSPPAPTTS